MRMGFEKRIIAILAISIIMMSSGCILKDRNDEKPIRYIFADQILDYNLVSSINYSQKEKMLESIGYDVRLFPEEFNPPGPGYRYGIEINRTGNSYFKVQIIGRSYNNTTLSMMSAYYNGFTGPFNRESQVNETKEYIENETNIIYYYMGISVNWRLTKWTIALGEGYHW